MFTTIFSMLYLLIGALFGLAYTLRIAEDEKSVNPDKELTTIDYLQYGITVIVFAHAWAFIFLYEIVAGAVHLHKRKKALKNLNAHTCLDGNHYLMAGPECLFDMDKDKLENSFSAELTAEIAAPVLRRHLEKALQETKRGEIRDVFSLARWIGKHCSAEEQAVFDYLEQEWGEDKANKWFEAILIQSGKVSGAFDGEGIVAVVGG